MKLLKYLFNTTALAFLIQPIFFYFLFNQLHPGESAPEITQVGVFGVAFFWPLFLVSLMVFGFLRFLRMPTAARLVLWMLLASAFIVLASLVYWVVFFDARFLSGSLLLCVPSILSSIIAILIRYPQFEQCMRVPA